MTTHHVAADDAGHVIVKADEVDQTGTDISPIPDDELMAEVVDGLTLEPSSVLDEQDQVASSSGNARSTGRPGLARDAAAPPPPMQPPPPAPGQNAVELAPDSLSLAQLRRIVQDIPRVEQQAYAFRYADTQPFPEELDEWFQYSGPERTLFIICNTSFHLAWQNFCHEHSVDVNSSYLDADREFQKSFLRHHFTKLQDLKLDLRAHIQALEVICYALCGVWKLTAGKSVDDYPEAPATEEEKETPRSKSLQIKWIVENVLLIYECDGISKLYEYMRSVYDKEASSLNSGSITLESEIEREHNLVAREREANLILTCMYFIVEVARRLEALDKADVRIRDAIVALQPSLLITLVKVISGLRWEESAAIPFTRIILLFWKTILLVFGGSQSLEDAKKALEPPMDIPEDPADRRAPFLTASPLDYHVFRQEVTSKYPAYNPPPPVIPLESDHNSMLPPFANHPSRLASISGASGQTAVGGSGSILHQPVHIATPAPSPPPSPIGPSGKAAKKQNYQTNQHFPFMYPPLDDSSNNIGGKGTSEMQDALVGKKWEGSDVPASIIEAGKLFSSHVKMTRATRQLWEERERFMKYERGWNSDDAANNIGPGIDEQSGTSPAPPDTRRGSENLRMPETENKDVQRRLDAVETFYVSVRNIPMR